MKTHDVIKKIVRSSKLRRVVARKSHYWFFAIYLSDYMQYPTAKFQREMFDLTEDIRIKAAVITSFRGSAKSTIMSLSYPLWAMITGQKKYIVLLSQNQQQCKLILANIRAELEKNELLIRDFGPFRQASEEWSRNSLMVESYGCRMASISCGESIRGIKHKHYRPDLIIADDVEDLKSVKTKEGRDNVFEWFTGDVMPVGDSFKTKTIVIGNMLHEDSLMMRLKNSVEEGKFNGAYREYPFFAKKEIPLWPEKFTSQDKIDELRASVVSEAAWQREFLLKIVPKDDAVVLREWLNFYNVLPSEETCSFSATGIDLAISEKETANYTAMVSARVYRDKKGIKIFILPYPVNKRLNFPDTLDTAKRLSLELGNGIATKLYIEDVGYQKSLIQQLIKEGFPAEAVPVLGHDKRERLSLTTPHIKNATVLFPKRGCEDLINQLVGFGYEKYDDLSDAFSILITKIIKDGIWEPLIGRA